MNLGLTTSFIVAGILLLSILSMNTNISQSSTELTMRQVTQLKANTITEILQKDIPNIGSDVNGRIASPITDAEKYKIEFLSNIDNSGSVETITWEWTSINSSSKNPNDKILVRDEDGTKTTFTKGVTNFEIVYLDKDRNKIDINLLSKLTGGTQSERDKIKYIEISLKMESEEQVGGAGASTPYFIETTWEKQFTPINLQL